MILRNHKFRTVLQVVLLSLLTAFLVIWRFGYHEVFSDTFILDLKGMKLADPTVLLNDWFTERVPQPHWIYDRWVATFYGLGVLPEAKLVAFVLSVVGLSYAIYLLIKVVDGGFLETCLMLVLIVMAPISILGSATLIVGWSLPHVWGSVGAILALALALNQRWLLALGLTLIVPLLHAQHGLHLGFIFFVVGLTTVVIKRDRPSIITTIIGFFAVCFSIWIAKAGAVAGLSSAYDRVCQVYAPFHCYSSLWPGHWWIPSMFLVPGVCLLVYDFWKKPALRSWAVAIGLIFAGYALALILEYLMIEPLAHFVRTVNAWRWITIFMPLALVGYLGLLKPKKWPWPLALALLPVWIFYTWQSTYTGLWGGVAWTTMAVILTGIFGLMIISSRFYSKGIVVVWLLANAFGIYYAGPEKADNSTLLEWGNVIERLVPPGEIIIADPQWLFVRHVSKRAVIVDFKGLPYDNPYLQEWEQRVSDIGASQYAQQDYTRWIQVARKYQTRYALIATTDAFFAEAQSRSQTLIQLPNSNVFVVRLNDVP